MVTNWSQIKKRLKLKDRLLCNLSKLIDKLVPPTGIEPAAQGLGIPCSIQLSYGGNPRLPASGVLIRFLLAGNQFLLR